MNKLDVRPADDAVQAALRAAICVPTRRYLWTPADEIEFVPALSDKVFGDGRALLALATIHSRPCFYVLRIDSRWRIELDPHGGDDASDFREFADDICWELEFEFGDGRPDENDEDPEVREYGEPWPAFDDRDGYSWGRKDWPDLPGISCEPHPFNRCVRVLTTRPSGHD